MLAHFAHAGVTSQQCCIIDRSNDSVPTPRLMQLTCTRPHLDKFTYMGLHWCSKAHPGAYAALELLVGWTAVCLHGYKCSRPAPKQIPPAVVLMILDKSYFACNTAASQDQLVVLQAAGKVCNLVCTKSIHDKNQCQAAQKV